MNYDHVCAENCSEFRNIDKLRLIYQAIDLVINFKEMKSSGKIESFNYIRNREAYKEKISYDKILFETQNNFDHPRQFQLLQTVRDFYGEKVAFYYTWLLNLNYWLLSLAIVGLFTYILGKIEPKENWFYFFYSFSISVWGMIYNYKIGAFYFKNWFQKEKLYSYFWGTSNFEESEPYRENFKSEEQRIIMFDYFKKKASFIKSIIKYIISYMIVAMCISFSLFMINLTFKWKALIRHHVEAIGNKAGFESIKIQMVSIYNSIQIKIMSFVYGFIARGLTEWENHSKDSEFDQFLTIKILSFEFMNNFYTLYYIAFFKVSI